MVEPEERFDVVVLGREAQRGPRATAEVLNRAGEGPCEVLKA